MIRRPPRSTLFPSRRSSDLSVSLWSYHRWTPHTNSPAQATAAVAPAVVACAGRSEEHTSELQSHVNLVCRLLLEKKKKKKKQMKINNNITLRVIYVIKNKYK